MLRIWCYKRSKAPIRISSGIRPISTGLLWRRGRRAERRKNETKKIFLLALQKHLSFIHVLASIRRRSTRNLSLDVIIQSLFYPFPTTAMPATTQQTSSSSSSARGSATAQALRDRNSRAIVLRSKKSIPVHLSRTSSAIVSNQAFSTWRRAPAPGRSSS